MAIITVSNKSELSSALSSAKGGDTIILANGDYGDLTINTDFASKVTLQAANDLGASLGAVKITGSNVTLDGFTINGRMTFAGADHVELVNSLGNSWNEVIGSSNVVIANNEFTATLSIEETTGFHIEGNYIHGYAGDLLRVTGNSSDGIIENNKLWDMVPVVHPDGTYIHADALQMFATTKGTPHDIVVRGNHIYDDPTTGDIPAQGIFISDGRAGYKNIIIEDNLVATNSAHGISFAVGTDGNIIRNNTVLGSGQINVNGGKHGADTSGVTIYDNVAKGVNAKDGAVVGDNYLYTNASDVFKNGGNGSQWQDFLPKEGGPIDLSTGWGAADKLLSLLNGTSYVPQPDEPVPTVPVPVPDSGTENGSDSDETPLQPENSDSSDQGQIEPDQINGTAFSMLGKQKIHGAGDVVEITHHSGLELETGTIALSFNADTVSGRMGLITKDASYYVGGGNHLAAYIENGTLIVRFQDDSGDAIARIKGIQANKDYDLQITFGDNEVAVWLDGQQVHSTDFSMNLAENVQHLQVGALGWASGSGEAGYSNVFDGGISDVVIVEGKWTPAQMQELIHDSRPLPVAQPEEPVAQPEEPVDQPEEPVAQPEEPVAQPEEPVAQPEEPVAQPEEPVAQPEEPVAQPEEPVAGTAANTIFAVDQAEFNGSKKSIINLDHNQALELNEGTFAFTFNADDLHGRQGLLSKDASYYVGGGNHLSIWLMRDDLILRYQDEDGDAYLIYENVKANQDYNVQTWFGDDEVGLAVNGELVETEDFAFDLGANTQNLQVGGLGWASSDGGDRVDYAFDGTLSDVMLLDQALPIESFDLLA